MAPEATKLSTSGHERSATERHVIRAPRKRRFARVRYPRGLAETVNLDAVLGPPMEELKYEGLACRPYDVVDIRCNRASERG